MNDELTEIRQPISVRHILNWVCEAESVWPEEQEQLATPALSSSISLGLSRQHDLPVHRLARNHDRLPVLSIVPIHPSEPEPCQRNAITCAENSREEDEI